MMQASSCTGPADVPNEQMGFFHGVANRVLTIPDVLDNVQIAQVDLSLSSFLFCVTHASSSPPCTMCVSGALPGPERSGGAN